MRFPEKALVHKPCLFQAVRIRGISTSWARMPGTAVSNAPDKKAWKGKLPPVRPASTKRTAPHTSRPATMAVTRAAYIMGRVCFTLRQTRPDTRP